MKRSTLAPLLLLSMVVGIASHGEEMRSFSGIYPSLAMFNDEGECGTGAVVPWADRLWVITYAPHAPEGSSDKLYEISTDLRQTVRPESVGGTPANRMIHDESGQLFIGPYVVDRQGHVRVIPPAKMFGRLTANARHLNDPAGKILYTTMEEGIYEVDVNGLEVKEQWADEATKSGRHSDLPGYHGKGSYSGQGVLVYANNGDHAPAALSDPATPSGALAEWNGTAAQWTLLRRNQFTEVTGPGGIHGASQPETDPIWSVGWDHRSLLLMSRQEGKWSLYRLPKGSHSYDGAHGWNTEWPRIREIGERDLLMTMHGTFWHFPREFGIGHTAGIAPRSNYLKVIGDFARWGERVVLGCDDTAKNEFLNKRSAKGNLAGPGQSQSNLWFIKPGQLDDLGPAIGAGSVWVDEPVKAHTPSDPFLFAGYSRRGLHIAASGEGPLTVRLEVDGGDGRWGVLREVEMAGSYAWVPFTQADQGAWIRVSFSRDVPRATATFTFSNPDERGTQEAALFAGLAPVASADYSAGPLLTRGGNLRTLSFGASVVKNGKAEEPGYYELMPDMQLLKRDDAGALEHVKTGAAIPTNVFTEDAASLLLVDDAKRRWRLPKGNALYSTEGPLGRRVCREIATERDLLSLHGTLYELPAENAGGFSKMRPVATHGFEITDYASYRGLLVLSGISTNAPAGEHIIRSDDGKVALWAGAVDDLWKLGKPRGHGGPWMKSAVQANTPSDAYLLRGYSQRELKISHTAGHPVRVTLQVDITGDGIWVPYQTFLVAAGETSRFTFPPEFTGYWLRVMADTDCQATAQLKYE